MTSQESFGFPSRSDDSWVENQPIGSRSVGTFRVDLLNLMTLPYGLFGGYHLTELMCRQKLYEKETLATGDLTLCGKSFSAYQIDHS